MKKIEVTDKLAEMAGTFRDAYEAEREGVNSYYENMELCARAHAGLATLLEKTRNDGDSCFIDPICTAIIALGRHAELLFELHLDRDQEYNLFSLDKIPAPTTL